MESPALVGEGVATDVVAYSNVLSLMHVLRLLKLGFHELSQLPLRGLKLALSKIMMPGRNWLYIDSSEEEPIGGKC